MMRCVDNCYADHQYLKKARGDHVLTLVEPRAQKQNNKKVQLQFLNRDKKRRVMSATSEGLHI